MHLNSSLKARARRKTAIGIALSVLLHVGLFTLLWYQIKDVVVPPVRPDPDSAPLVVSFLKDTPAPSAKAISQPPPKSAPQPPAKHATAPKPQKPPKLAVRRPTPIAQVTPAPSPVQPTEQPPEQPAEIKPAPPEMDMSTMINAARERRRAAAEADAPINSEAQADGAPADNAVAKANIAFLMRKGEGGGGVFQIISKGPRVAQYVFRGWGATAHENRRQLIEVDAGENGDIEVAIIKSMIELIRKRYPGDFKWDSHRLGRLVELSARETDGPALQAFLMHEFFDGH